MKNLLPNLALVCVILNAVSTANAGFATGSASRAQLPGQSTNHMYQAFPNVVGGSQKTWNQASNACVSIGAHLATPNTNAEWQYIYDAIDAYVYGNGGGGTAYIGIFRAANVVDTWQAVNSETLYQSTQPISGTALLHTGETAGFGIQENARPTKNTSIIMAGDYFMGVYLQDNVAAIPPVLVVETYVCEWDVMQTNDQWNTHVIP